MSLAKMAVQLFVPKKKIEEYNHFLFVGPHPDDIEIGAGATISKLSAMGKKISFLICTDGRFGDGHSNGVKGDALAELREAESMASAKRLGVSDIRFLRLCDGANYAYEELMQKIAEAVSDINPDIIFAPDPLSASECHLDHINVGSACKTVACFAPYAGVMDKKFSVKPADVQAIAFYMTCHTNSYVRLTRHHYAAQLSALFDCHTSQYPAKSPEAGALKTYLEVRSVQYGFKRFSRFGEGFRVLDATRMHCLPEAE